MTQRDRVLSLLRLWGGSGVSSARFVAAGIYRYSARIEELRTRGYTIESVRPEVGNTWVYKLVGEPS